MMLFKRTSYNTFMYTYEYSTEHCEGMRFDFYAHLLCSPSSNQTVGHQATCRVPYARGVRIYYQVTRSVRWDEGFQTRRPTGPVLRDRPASKRKRRNRISSTGFIGVPEGPTWLVPRMFFFFFVATQNRGEVDAPRQKGGQSRSLEGGPHGPFHYRALGIACRCGWAPGTSPNLSFH